MKKVILLAIMALSAAFIISCSEDQKTELKFTNSYTVAVKEIKWTDSNATPDAIWTGELAVGATNAKQEVKIETGQAHAQLADGTNVLLEYIDTGGAPQKTKTLGKNEENTWVISAAAKK